MTISHALAALNIAGSVCLAALAAAYAVIVACVARRTWVAVARGWRAAPGHMNAWDRLWLLDIALINGLLGVFPYARNPEHIAALEQITKGVQLHRAGGGDDDGTA